MNKLESLALGRSVPHTLVRFALPVIAGLLLMRINTAVDHVLVGQAISTVGVAAITICDPFVLLITALAVLVGDGGSFVIALSMGAHDTRKAARAAGTGIAAAAVLSLAFALTATLFADPLLRFAGASETLLPHARPFLQIIAWSSLFTAFSSGISSFVRTAGYPNRVFAIQTISILCNIALGYLLVIVMDTGTAGAACATAIGQAAATIATIAFLLKRDMPFKLRARDLVPDFRMLFKRRRSASPRAR